MPARPKKPGRLGPPFFFFPACVSGVFRVFTTSLILAFALVFFYFSVWEDFFWAFQLQNTELVHETILGRTMFYDVPCSGQREGAPDRWGYFFFPSESMSDGFAQAPSASNGPVKLRTHSLCILCAPLQKLGGTA